MKKIILLGVLILAAAMVFVGVKVGISAWKNLEAKISSPDFKSKLELELAKLTAGEVHIGSLQGRLSLHPGISAQNFSIVLSNKTIELKADSLQLDLRILPLLRKEIVFSHIHVTEPQLIIRRLKGGKWTTLGDLFSGPGLKSAAFSVEELTIDKARITVYDLNVSTIPLVKLKIEASTTFSSIQKKIEMKLRGKFRSGEKYGPFEIKGQVFPEIDLHLNISDLPSSLIARFVSMPSFVQGDFDVSAYIHRARETVRWNFKTIMKNIEWTNSDQILPFQLAGEMDSSGPLLVKAKWDSITTQASAVLRAEKWDQLNYTVSLNSSRLNVLEWMDAFQPLFSSDTVKSERLKKIPTWSIQADWDLQNIDFPRESVASLNGSATVKSDRGRISKFSAEALGGVVTASASWKMDILNLHSQGNGIKIENMLGLMFSTVPWSGAINFNLDLDGFPILNTSQFNVAQVVDSLSKSRSAAINVQGEASIVEKIQLRNIVGNLALNPEGSVYQGQLMTDWEGGGLKCSASIPHLINNSIHSPVELNLKIDNLDLKNFPNLAEKFDISRASLTAEAVWRTSSLNNDAIHLFSPESEWSVEGNLKNSIWRGITLDNISGKLSWDRLEFRLENFLGGTSQGTFSGNGSLSNLENKKFHKFSVDGKINNVQMEPFMFAFSTNPILVNGLLTSTLNLSGDIDPFNSQSLRGSVTVNGHSGYFRAGSFLLSLFTKLNLQSLFQTVKGKHQQSGFPFDVIFATGTISEGQIKFEKPLAIKNPGLELAYTGEVGSDLKSAKGVLVVNPLVGTRNLVGAIPGVSTLVLGSNGEFLPLIVDLKYRHGNLETTFRSIKTLAGPAVRIIGNVIRLPVTLYEGVKNETGAKQP